MGSREGLKIPWSVMTVRVQVPSPVQNLLKEQQKQMY